MKHKVVAIVAGARECDDACSVYDAMYLHMDDHISVKDALSKVGYPATPLKFINRDGILQSHSDLYDAVGDRSVLFTCPPKAKHSFHAYGDHGRLPQKNISMVGHQLYQIPDISQGAFISMNDHVTVEDAIFKAGIRAVYLTFCDAQPMLAGDDDLYAAVSDGDWVYTWPWPSYLA
jgi:hypothetical protein